MVGEPHGGRHRDEQRVDAVLGLTLAIGLMDGDGGDGCGRLSLDVAGEQAEIVLAPALQRVEGAPVLLGDVCGHGGGLPRRWLGGPPLGPLDRPAGAGPPPLDGDSPLDAGRSTGCVADAGVGRNVWGRDRKGECFVLTVESVATIGLSEGPGTLGRRRTGERADEWAEMADLT